MKRNKLDFMTFIEKTSFLKIFLVWILIIVAFGLIYHVTAGTGNTLKSSTGNAVTGMADYVYYSFITATSTGYGDIIPEGTGMRFLAITNVIIGMLVMAVVTSKIVSIKQDRLLENIYQISFSEKLNRNISGLTLFKGESDKIIESLKSNEIVDRKNLFSIRMSLSILKNNLAELRREISEGKFSSVDKSFIEQLIIGLDHDFENIKAIVRILDRNDVSFKNPKVLEDIYEISNIGIQITKKSQEEFPIYTQRIKAINKNISLIKKTIMQFRIIDLHKEMEINVSLPINKA